MVLDLDEKAVRAKGLAVPLRSPFRPFQVAIQDVTWDLARIARTQGNDALRMLCQKRLIDARLVVKALQLRSRGDLKQVLVAGLVLSQQHQVIRISVFLRVAIRHSPGSDIDLDAGDRLDTLIPAGTHKVDDAVHHPVIGEGNGRHLQLFGSLGQVADPAQAIEQRELAMNVQMYKVGHQRAPQVRGDGNQNGVSKQLF